MPVAIRHPEEIMRETKQDLFFMEFLFKDKWYSFFPEFDKLSLISREDVKDYNDPPGRQEILDWLADNLPDTKWETLAPKERSGVLAGGVYGRLCIHFDEASLKKFCDRWEVDDRSVDPRFQLGLFYYKEFAEQDQGPPNYDDFDP